MSDDRFKQSVVANLAKRAANRCSNPDCMAITSGPSNAPGDSVNVGEAAHIYGANPGSARYDPDMVSADRADITNAIWLCGNCHKLIDDDPLKFPSGLLFEWQREHEKVIGRLVGKPGAEIRSRYQERHLEEFGRLSYLAERLVLEKGEGWEYLLTAEVLRYETEPILHRWSALSRGLYMKPMVRIARIDTMDWIQDRNAELGHLVSGFSTLMNDEFTRAWGPPGMPGNDADIVTTCRLFAEMCKGALAWEETLRFAAVNDLHAETHALFVGVAGRILDEAAKVPAFLSNLVEGGLVPGQYSLNLKLTLPDDWAESVTQAYARAVKRIAKESG